MGTCTEGVLDLLNTMVKSESRQSVPFGRKACDSNRWVLQPEIYEDKKVSAVFGARGGRNGAGSQFFLGLHISGFHLAVVTRL